MCACRVCVPLRGGGRPRGLLGRGCCARMCHAPPPPPLPPPPLPFTGGAAWVDGYVGGGSLCAVMARWTSCLWMIRGPCAGTKTWAQHPRLAFTPTLAHCCTSCPAAAGPLASLSVRSRDKCLLTTSRAQCPSPVSTLSPHGRPHHQKWWVCEPLAACYRPVLLFREHRTPLSR